MNQLMEQVKGYFDLYFAGGMYLLLLLSELFYIYVRDGQKEKNKELLQYYPVFMLVVIGNPVVIYVATKYMIGSVYWRAFWLLPVLIVIAYGMTRVVASEKRTGRLLVALLCAILLIVVSGSNIATRDNYDYAENKEKLPQAAIEIADIIKNHSERMADTQENQPKAIVDGDLICYIRQYNATIKLLYGRNVTRITNPKSKALLVYSQLQAEYPDFAYVVKIARKYKCNYLVVKNTDYAMQNLTDLDFQLVQAYDVYSVFYDKK
ncbi:hypothetical protein LQZ18_13010 [Lachnospiraceae bacterium ZAX-1]